MRRHRGLSIIVFVLSVCAIRGVSAIPVTVLACKSPDNSFQSFLRRFEDDAPFRRSRLQLPLVVLTGNGISVSRTIEFWTLPNLRALKGPLIYSRSDLKKYDLAETILVLQPKRYAEVLQANAGEADDTKLIFRFRRIDGCWALEGFEDVSE